MLAFQRPHTVLLKAANEYQRDDFETGFMACRVIKIHVSLQIESAVKTTKIFGKKSPFETGHSLV